MGVRGDLEGYTGEGHIELLVRQHGFLGTETYGYALILPTISTLKSSETIYRLTGLPLRDGLLNVELATFVPIFGESITEADRRALSIPDDHNITCKLIDSGSGRELGHSQGAVKALAGSRTLQFKGAIFMKHLFAVGLTDLQTTGRLDLSMTYDVGNSPLPGYLQIVLISDAPASR